jgi:hypothetical protein
MKPMMAHGYISRAARVPTQECTWRFGLYHTMWMMWMIPADKMVMEQA